MKQDKKLTVPKLCSLLDITYPDLIKTRSSDDSFPRPTRGTDNELY